MQTSTAELGNPFLSPAFAIATARVRPGARAVVLEDGNDIVGFFAFEQGAFRRGRALAAGVSDCQGVVHSVGLAWNPLDVLEWTGLDVWEFDNLIGCQVASFGQNVRTHSSPIIDVSRGYDLYVTERRRSSKRTLRSLGQKQRNLVRAHGPIQFDFDSRDERALNTLMEWKSRQYRRTGRRDRFAVRWIERLVRDLFETRSETCSGTLSVLYAGERIVAVHFGLRAELSLSCWFPAYDPEFAKYSPGLLLHMSMASAAATAGLRLLDLGKGDERYKQSIKSGDLTVGEGWIRRPSAAAMLQTAQRSPARLASDFVLSHPRLRRTARETLRRVGTVRSKL